MIGELVPVVLLFILALLSLLMLAARTLQYTELVEKYGGLKVEYRRALDIIAQIGFNDGNDNDGDK